MIARVNLVGLNVARCYHLWSAELGARPAGAQALCPAGTREIYLDPDATTAGALLEIRETVGDAPRYMRPGDRLRFGTARSSFHVRNALAEIKTRIVDPITYGNGNFDGTGYVTILAGDFLGAFAEVRRDCAHPLVAAMRQENWLNLTPAMTFTPVYAMLIGAGFSRMRLTFSAHRAGDAYRIATPADIAGTLRFFSFGGWHTDALPAPDYWQIGDADDPYLVSPLPPVPNDGGILWVPQGADDITINAANLTSEREIKAPALVYGVSASGIAGTGLGSIRLHMEAY